MKYLVETCLLTHGLKSITNEQIRKVWTETEENIAWVSEGEIKIGGMEEYLEFRNRAASVIRIDCFTLEKAIEEKLSGALTASGTMAVCKKYGIPLAVTCGMGGIGDIKEERLCPDLPALADLPVTLISTGPKDMLARKETIQWLTDNGVRVIGSDREFCTGYVFVGEKVELQGMLEKGVTDIQAPLLIIKEIPEEKRVEDRSILAEAVEEGKRAEKEGRYFHPAVNGRIDDLTKGYASFIQLESLLANAKLAKELTKDL